LLNFTRQERVVVYFLVVTLGIGGILKYFRDRQLDDTLKPSRFYEEEQEFKELAGRINHGELMLNDSLELLVENTNEFTIADSSGVVRGLKIISINTAGVEELTSLPGIGPVLAERIRTYIEENGPFKSKKEITLVKGVGDKLYARIQDLVTTE